MKLLVIDMITDEDKKLIERALAKAPKSAWGYWGFLLPVLIVVAGVLVNTVIILYYRQRIPLEVLMRCGDRTDLLWNSELVWKVATVSVGCVIASAWLLICLALQTVKQTRLIGKLTQELKERR